MPVGSPCKRPERILAQHGLFSGLGFFARTLGNTWR